MLTYLVGSCTGSMAMPDSDYDIVVVMKQALMPGRRASIEHELAAILEAEMVLLIPLDHAKERRSYAIVVHGIPVFENDLGERIAYEARVLESYRDLLERFPRSHSEHRDPTYLERRASREDRLDLEQVSPDKKSQQAVLRS